LGEREGKQSLNYIKINSKIWFGPVNSNLHFEDCKYKQDELWANAHLWYPRFRQTGSRNLTGPQMLPTIWGTYMKLVTKYQISAINSCWEKCYEKWAYMFNVYKNQQSRQTGSRNLMGPKTLPTKSIQKWLHNNFLKNMVLVDYIVIFFTCANTFGHILYIFLQMND
jgi:hypothetical protein